METAYCRRAACRVSSSVTPTNVSSSTMVPWDRKSQRGMPNVNGHGPRKSRSPDRTTGDQPVNRLLELAEIPRPRVRPEPGDHVGAEPHVPSVPTIEVLEKERREDGNLFPSLSQRRNPQLDHVETVQFLAEAVSASGLHTGPGGCDGAHVDPEDLAAAGARDLTRPQQVNEPGGQDAREGADLVQVDRAVVRELETPEQPPRRQG